VKKILIAVLLAATPIAVLSSQETLSRSTRRLQARALQVLIMRAGTIGMARIRTTGHIVTTAPNSILSRSSHNLFDLPGFSQRFRFPLTSV
jgi:hypothetical protein